MTKNTTPTAAGNEYPDLPPGRRRQPLHVEHLEDLPDPTDTPRPALAEQHDLRRVEDLDTATDAHTTDEDTL